MSVKISGRALGATAVELVHEPSGARLRTMAPKDNGGDGSAFSPTDLCAASLAACAATIMSLFAARNGIPLEVEFEIEKVMAQAPRRIGRLSVTFRLKTDCGEADFERIVEAGKTCPVRQSLAPGVSVEESYVRL